MSLTQAVIGRVIHGVFQHVHFYHAACLVEQFQTIGTQVAQVQFFSELGVTLGQSVYRFQAGMILDARVLEPKNGS